MARIIQTTKEDSTFKPSIIVIDSLRSITDCDENSSDIALILNKIKTLAKQTNTTIFLIIHSSEKSDSKYRGSTAIKDKVAEMYHVSYEQIKDKREITVQNIKSRRGLLNYKWIYESQLFNFVRTKASRSLIPSESKPMNFDFGLVKYETLMNQYVLDKYTYDVLSANELATKDELQELLKDTNKLYEYLLNNGFNFNEKISAESIRVFLQEAGFQAGSKGIITNSMKVSIVKRLNEDN
jgi:hypothetical protein